MQIMQTSGTHLKCNFFYTHTHTILILNCTHDLECWDLKYMLKISSFLVIVPIKLLPLYLSSYCFIFSSWMKSRWPLCGWTCCCYWRYWWWRDLYLRSCAANRDAKVHTPLLSPGKEVRAVIHSFIHPLSDAFFYAFSDLNILFCIYSVFHSVIIHSCEEKYFTVFLWDKLYHMFQAVIHSWIY